MSRTLELSTTLQLPQADAFALLTAYDRYQQLLPEVSRSRTLAREGDIVIAELVCPWLAAAAQVLELVHTPPASVVFSQADRYRHRGLSGRLDLVPALDDQACTVLTVSARLPFSLRLSGRRRLRDGLRAFADGMHRASLRAAPRAAASPERTKICEIVRREHGLELWFRGERFTLQPAAAAAEAPEYRR